MKQEGKTTGSAATPVQASSMRQRRTRPNTSSGKNESSKNDGYRCEHILPAIALPDHFFVRQNLLGYLDLPSAVLLASCSRSLQRFVYEGDPARWNVIDFGSVPKRQAAKVTDRALRGLLTRVDARRVTRVLSLRGCTSVRGYGLDAIVGARCVEEIDLILSDDHLGTLGPTGLDDSYVLNVVLSGMAPICTDESKLVGSFSSPDSLGLSLVKFRRQFRTGLEHDVQILGWKTRLRDALRTAAEERKPKGGQCLWYW